VKLVFSRKGFDSSFGGGPSPIIEGRPLSMPIPAGNDPSITRYGDLASPYPEVISDLYSYRRRGVQLEDYCHLDPDIRASALSERPRGWRGAFGQSGAAASYLKNQQVGVGDLFLFFGLFRFANKTGSAWRFYGNSEHRIYGWLQVGEVLECSTENCSVREGKDWLSNHPHTYPGNARPNLIFIAVDQLSFAPGVPGYGLFGTGVRLSAGDRPSVWRLPSWLNPLQGGVGLSRHSPQRWDSNGLLRTVSPGQEFIAPIKGHQAALDWLSRLFESERPTSSPSAA